MRRIIFILAVLVIVGAVAAAGPVLAAKGGNGKGKGGGGGGNDGGGGDDSPVGTATLTLSPNPVGAFGEYVVSGSGFKANDLVSVGIKHPDATYWTTVMTDGSGAFTVTKTAKDPGEVIHEAYQQKNKRSWQMKASATLSVVQ